ncbi:hypothetical protein CSE16_18105 [Solibacillus sp. R5-41]|uniref:DUF3006 domain-containing protein n=1 Tax=Solibacillus sp. R5-41 TaxID=2048654 RepID=UPI000C129272|nr:DUF3006 domain-containing protein [Solibacillus sp. R5-41]ATP41795.1 hypothetical protein CSE16_18105 [Solibacillus sp. R5-41]
MSYHKYTLDRFDGEYAVFLKRPDETEKLLIQRTEILVALQEGDIVRIQEDGEKYLIEVLQEEINAQKDRIQQLMKQLRRQSK